MSKDSGDARESITDGELIDGDESPFVEFGQPRPRRRPKPLTLIVSLIAIAVLVAGVVTLALNISNKSDTQKIQGKVAMDEKELRAIVHTKHLVVYWAGSLAGYKYALIAEKPGSAFVRYLPNGQGLNDETMAYRVIATYALKGAFSATQAAGAEVGRVGFTNVDGNAIFYTTTRPTNVFMGMRDKDIQVEIFDPGVDQALGLALIHNLIQPI